MMPKGIFSKVKSESAEMEINVSLLMAFGSWLVEEREEGTQLTTVGRTRSRSSSEE